MSYKAIEISEAANCRTSYVFVDFIYNHMHVESHVHTQWFRSLSNEIYLSYKLKMKY